MILNYFCKTNYFDREKIRFAVNNQFHFHCQVVWPFVEKCDCPRAGKTNYFDREKIRFAVEIIGF